MLRSPAETIRGLAVSLKCNILDVNVALSASEPFQRGERDGDIRNVRRRWNRTGPAVRAHLRNLRALLASCPHPSPNRPSASEKFRTCRAVRPQPLEDCFHSLNSISFFAPFWVSRALTESTSLERAWMIFFTSASLYS